MPQQCPECGAVWRDGNTCQDHFHQMLTWEYEYSLPDVHHLMVLCYHLQHPALYSPEGLREATSLLAEFVERGTWPGDVRRRNRSRLDSHNRKWKIKGTATSHGAYPREIEWTMRAADVVSSGPERYYETVRAWARSILKALQNGGKDA